jgi:hypothetical protein
LHTPGAALTYFGLDFALLIRPLFCDTIPVEQESFFSLSRPLASNLHFHDCPLFVSDRLSSWTMAAL